MKLTVFGASGAVGRLLTDQALGAGHQVTVFVRRPDVFPVPLTGLTVVVGTFDNQSLVNQAVAGADAVLSTLGPALDYSRKSKGTPIADAVRAIVEGMTSQGVPRLVVLATPTVRAPGEPSVPATVLPGFLAKALFPNPYQDILSVGRVVTGSGLDWTLVRIINPNLADRGRPYGSWTGTGAVRFGVSRRNIASFMLEVGVKHFFPGQMPIVFDR